MPDRRVPVLFAWNDLLWSLLACLLVTVLLVSEQRKPVDPDTEKAAGAIAVYVFWPDNIDLDIDTHLQSPDGDHVYYKHPSGKVWNLLRDDMGMINDPGKRNFENAYARAVPGAYTVNVAVYRGNAGMFPVAVDVEIRIGAGSPAAQVLHRTVTLENVADEQTAFSFAIDDRGYLVPGSESSLLKPLAGAP